MSNFLGFATLGHYIATGASKLKAALVYTEQKIVPTVVKIDQAAEKTTAVLAAAGVPYASEALEFERLLESAAGEFLSAIHTADPISGATSVDVKIGIDTYNQFKSFIDQYKDKFSAIGHPLP
jgi:hypothetical protein